jgi:hypothetical protein
MLDLSLVKLEFEDQGPVSYVQALLMLKDA